MTSPPDPRMPAMPRPLSTYTPEERLRLLTNTTESYQPFASVLVSAQDVRALLGQLDKHRKRTPDA